MKKKHLYAGILLLSFLLVGIQPALAQVSEEWVKRYNGPANGYDYASAIAVDSSGNVYVTGNSYGSGTDSDYATIKYNSAGEEMWPSGVRRYNGLANRYDGASAIAVDSSGNVYVTGLSYGCGPYTEYPEYTYYATIKYAQGIITAPTELSVMVGRWSPLMDEAIVAAVAEFEESHKVKIKLIPVSNEIYWVKVGLAFARGSPPDALWVTQAMAVKLRGHLIKLDCLVAEWPELIEGIPDWVLDRFRYNDHLYAIPYGAEGRFTLQAYALSSRAKAYWATKFFLWMRDRFPPP